MIKNYNTIEDFKKADRPAMLKRTAQTVCYLPVKLGELC